MEKENKIKAPTVEVIIRTTSEWEGKEVSTCKREFLNEDTIRWPNIIETFYGALRGFDYVFPENVKQSLEELSEYEFDPDSCFEETEKSENEFDPDSCFEETEKKYELTDETKEWNGHTLHRIRALKNFGEVEEGKLGGWIESEDNLSQEGKCWVDDDAIVCGNAQVWDNATVYKHAVLFDDADVWENARVFGCARVFDRAKVFGNAKVYGYANVSGNANVNGNSFVYENAKVWEYSRVFGNARVHGDAEVYGSASVHGNVNVCMKAEVHGTADIWCEAVVDYDISEGVNEPDKAKEEK